MYLKYIGVLGSVPETHLAIRVTQYSENIAELALRYSPDFFSEPIGFRRVHKYALIKKESDGSYLFMISQAEAPSHKYNVIMTVMGPVKERVDQFMTEFEEALNVKTRPAPQILKDQFEIVKKLLGA